MGTTGIGVCAPGVEYFDEPALTVMLLDVSPDAYRVFSGTRPLSQALAQGFQSHTALVHADGQTTDLSELIAELADGTISGHVFGGLACGRGSVPQWALPEHSSTEDGVFLGGLSGPGFACDAGL